jgi:hypothetical protein
MRTPHVCRQLSTSCAGTSRFPRVSIHRISQDAHPFLQQPNPSRAIAERMERSIEQSALESTVVRAGMFAVTPGISGDRRFALAA